jgi:hypothetical protein
MVRITTFLLFLVSVASMGQTIEVIDRALMTETICGPIAVKAKMLDTSSDGLVIPHQRVGFTLRNLKPVPIVLERMTLHFERESPTSGAPFEWVARVPVGSKQEAALVELTTVPNPVGYVVVNSVSYADGSNWLPNGGAVCKAVLNPIGK